MNKFYKDAYGNKTEFEEEKPLANFCFQFKIFDITKKVMQSKNW